jgi:hypothetical protein
VNNPVSKMCSEGHLEKKSQVPEKLNIKVRQNTVSVELHPFNDRQYNRDLITLYQRVNERQVRLPDGRLLVFSVNQGVKLFGNRHG